MRRRGKRGAIIKPKIRREKYSHIENQIRRDKGKRERDKKEGKNTDL